MNLQLLRVVVHVDSCRAGCFVGGVRLGDALDGNVLASQGVLGAEDEAEGAMVERRDSQKSVIEKFVLYKAISQTGHWRKLPKEAGARIEDADATSRKQKTIRQLYAVEVQW